MDFFQNLDLISPFRYFQAPPTFWLISKNLESISNFRVFQDILEAVSGPEMSQKLVSGISDQLGGSRIVKVAVLCSMHIRWAIFFSEEPPYPQSSVQTLP